MPFGKLWLNCSRLCAWLPVGFNKSIRGHLDEFFPVFGTSKPVACHEHQLGWSGIAVVFEEIGVFFANRRPKSLQRIADVYG